MGRNITQHDCISANIGIITQMHLAKHLCTCPHVHPVAQLRSIKGLVDIAIAKRHALPDDAIVAEDAATVDNNAALVFNNHPAANFGRVGYFDAVGVADFAVQHSVKDAERGPQQFGLDKHSPYPKSVNGDRPKSRLCPIFAMGDPIFADHAPQTQRQAL